MTSFLTQYFQAEKSATLLVMIIGLIGLGLGLYFLFKTDVAFLKGMAYPMLVFALIQVGVGADVYFRTDAQITALETQYQNDRMAFQTEEGGRMEKVNRSFKTLKIVWMALIGISLLLILLLRSNIWWLGLGIGLLLQSSFLLAFDSVAEQRAIAYYEAIVEL